VRTGAGVVAEPDAEVLDFLRVLLVDLEVRAVSVAALPVSSLSVEIFGEDGCIHTLLRLMISPLAFLTFFSFARKYQKRDFATTSFGAKMRMR